MTEAELAPILVSLAVLVAAAQVLGFVAVKLHQPRLVGEILAGILLGPFVLGYFAPDVTRTLLGDSPGPDDPLASVLGFAGWLGLLLLMFISGTEVRRVLTSEQRRPTAWILGVGTAIPFLIVFGLAAVLPTDDLRGPRGGEAAFLVVLATAAAITSIPVISRIFHDLRILHTRFASLILGSAMLEDIALFAAIAIATALAQPAASSLGVEFAGVIAVSVAYFAVGLLVAPRILHRIHNKRWNILARRAPVAYALVLMLTYTAAAALLEVNIVFGAFLAGFGLVGGFRGSERSLFSEHLDAIRRVAFASFIPLFFVLIGTRLELGAEFSVSVLLAFLVGSSLLRIGSVATAGRLAGFSSRDAADVAVAMNARGGPGIVLATVGFEAGIISSGLFTALVLTAIVTSQAAGWWLDRALRERGELLGEEIFARPASRERPPEETEPFVPEGKATVLR